MSVPWGRGVIARGQGKHDKSTISARLPTIIPMERTMPADVLPRLEELPRRNATQVKNKWADVVREVRKAGSVAVTQHDRIEMVVMDAETYRKISALAEAARARSEAGLAALSAEFDRRLASLGAEGIRGRVESVMSARGRARRRGKAGTSF
jgi:prevent-host-death family protein